MDRTHLFELVSQINIETDLKLLSVCYTFDGIEAIAEDKYDKQHYHIKLTPTTKDKL